MKFYSIFFCALFFWSCESFQIKEPKLELSEIKLKNISSNSAKLDLNLKLMNQSSLELAFDHIFVEIFHQNEVLATAHTDESYKVKALSEAIVLLEVKLDWMKALKLASLKLKSREPLTLFWKAKAKTQGLLMSSEIKKEGTYKVQ